MGADKVAQLATLIGAIVSFISVVTGFILSKRKDKDTASFAERQQLSADQKAFIDNLKEENDALRERLDKLQAEFFTLKEQALTDRIEKEQLVAEVAELRGIIDRRQIDKEGPDGWH